LCCLLMSGAAEAVTQRVIVVGNVSFV